MPPSHHKHSIKRNSHTNPVHKHNRIKTDISADREKMLDDRYDRTIVEIK